MVTLVKKLIIKTLNLKLVIQLEYVPNWSEVFVTEKLKNTVPWTYVISDLKD